MSIWQTFLEKKSKISSDSVVTAEFIRGFVPHEMVKAATGDLFLIKSRLTPDDAEAIEKFNGECVACFAHPRIWEAYQLQERLQHLQSIKSNVSVQYVNTVGLNWIHYNDTLYIFDENAGTVTAEYPDAVKLHPVKRTEIYEFVTVDAGDITAPSEQAAPAVGGEMVGGSAGTAETASNPEDADSQRVRLLREAISRHFSENYCLVKTEFHGCTIENKKISLSNFYRKYQISKGYLIGSWRVFPDDSKVSIIDKGIVQKAVDQVNDQFTCTCAGFRILPRTTREQYDASIKQIHDEFVQYLNESTRPFNTDNKEGPHTIGGIPVNTPFSPGQALSNTRDSLQKYLESLSFPKQYEFWEWQNEVNCFIDKNFPYERNYDWAKDVEIKTTYTNFDTWQWEDSSFIEQLLESDRKHLKTWGKVFFDSEIYDLMNQYVTMTSQIYEE